MLKNIVVLPRKDHRKAKEIDILRDISTNQKLYIMVRNNKTKLVYVIDKKEEKIYFDVWGTKWDYKYNPSKKLLDFLKSYEFIDMRKIRRKQHEQLKRVEI